MRNPIVIPLVMLGLAGFSSAGAEDTAIVNPSVTVTSLSADELKDVFLGKKSAWDDGSKIVVSVAKDGAGLMSVLGKSPQQFTTSWKKLVFTGKGVMPEQVDNDDAVVAFVAKTPGAIGYVDKAKVKDGVKVVAVK